MNTGSIDESCWKSRQMASAQRCPECGNRMAEVERRDENGVLFVWYECSRDDCDGQWLKKTMQESLDIPISNRSQ
jgi:hypothetical protein